MSRSISESPLDFEIMRVDCNAQWKKRFLILDAHSIRECTV